MKKQFAAIFAATAVLGVTTAFAANPFSDVTPDSWAYQAVSQLANAGIVNGYPDGTFKGQNNITRYEMAQMVAKAMANQDRANAEQQAMINRLADEFSNELNNLGVRVARLEDRVGNVKVTGDARLRYQDGSKKAAGSFVNSNSKKAGASQFDARARVQFNAKVNDRTDAVVRLTSGNFELGNSENGSNANATIDRAYVNHKFGERVSAKAGRFGQAFGGGLAFDGTFDGAQLNAGNDKVNFQAAYGYMVSGDNGKIAGATTNKLTKDANVTNTYLGLNGKVGKHTTVGGFYDRVNQDSTNGYKNIYGFNADANFDKVWVGGEWLKDSHVDNSQAWTAGLGYGDYNIAKKGSWDVKGQYFNAKANAPIVDTTYNHIYTTDAKGWMASVNYALQNNVGLSANYGFDWKTQDGADLSDFYRADLNYKF